MKLVETYRRSFGAALVETQRMAYVETVVGLAVLVLLNLIFFRVDNWGFFDSDPHPFWIVVVPVAARYGALPGYLSGAASALVYVLLVVLQPRSAFTVDILSAEAILNPVLFLIVGGGLGELRESQKRAHKALAAKYDEVEVSLQDLAQRYLAAVEINREIQRRIATQTSTVTTLYQTAKGLEALDIEALSSAVLEPITGFIEADACAVYLRSNGRFVLKRGRPEQVSFARPTELDTSRGMLALVYGEKRTVTVRDVITEATPAQIASQPLLMATPLLGRGQEVIGILTVERMPFLRFTPTAVKLFALLGDWASSAFQTALQFQETRDRNVEDDLTGAYRYSHVSKRLGEEIARARTYSFPLTVAALRVEQYKAIPSVRLPSALQTLGLVFRQHLRPIDILGKSSTDDVFLIVLPHLGVEESETLTRRIQQEIDAFGFRPFESDRTLHIEVGLASATPLDAEPDALIERALRMLSAGAPTRFMQIDAAS